MGLNTCAGVRNPAGKIAEKTVWRSVFLTIWHRILNADLTKTPSSSGHYVNFMTSLTTGCILVALKYFLLVIQ